jgi:pyruvate,orthophosphate dikinase
MVFGNRGPDSATGVIFTRDPATGERRLYGDVLFGAQGEDVVAGTHATEPVSVLATRLPAVWEQLLEYAAVLERHHADICDIEFTIEAGRLWLLQVRVGKRSARAALRAAVEMAEDPTFPLSRRQAVERVAHLLAHPPTIVLERDGKALLLTTGLAASPGLASGAIVTAPEAAVAAAEMGRAVILVRPATSPDDVHGMARAAGILTATGGLASHAAVVARGWDIPAVVGAGDVVIEGERVTIGHHGLRVGDVISIDGTTGEVFLGPVAVRSEVVPEAATLLAWARELDVPVGRAAGEPTAAASAIPGPDTEPGAAPAGGPPAGGGAALDEVVRTLLIKGFVTPDLLAPALGVDPEQAAGVLDRLVADGVAEHNAGMFRLTADGRAMALERLRADREAWGAEQAEQALDAFLALDGRIKVIVTAWQMREVDGRQVLNDHSDPTYDAAVLADLGALHEDARALLEPLTHGLARLAGYLERLDRAARRAREGDRAYVASPRVDSYHGIWFELHEELILLAGRTRQDEVAAGRA